MFKALTVLIGVLAFEAPAAETNAFFPLMAWNWAGSNPAALKTMRDCGLTVAHFNYREATGADLRFQVYSTLAYGGRGIAYFTYVAPSVGNYRMAPVDQFGHLTPTWSHLQNVNRQVGQLAPHLLDLTSDDVYHFGEVPSGAHPPGPGSLVSGVGGAPFVVGDLTHRDGSRYVLIVNKDFAKSHHCAPEFRSPPSEVQLVSSHSGQLVRFAGEHQWLAPGQGSLLRLR